TGDPPAPVTPPNPFPQEGTGPLTLLLVLRAFASGSVGLTGSEAVANGVPSFRRPEETNAIKTLVLMGTIFATIFIAITWLSTTIGIQTDIREQETVNSMMTKAIVGAGTPFYYIVQITTAVILLLAANTGFTGFPRLASVLANDRFMPRHFADVGSRLAFNFGIVVLALLAGVILMAFGGSVTNLVPLYTIGVFLAFTLSQSGLVGRWRRVRVFPPPIVIVPIARLDRAALQALAFARSVSPNVKAVHISTSNASAEEFRRRWGQLDTDIKLDIVVSPYRSLMAPLLKYIG